MPFSGYCHLHFFVSALFWLEALTKSRFYLVSAPLGIQALTSAWAASLMLCKCLIGLEALTNIKGAAVSASNELEALTKGTHIAVYVPILVGGTYIRFSFQ